MAGDNRGNRDAARQLIRQYIPQLPSLMVRGLGYHMAGSLTAPKPTRLGLKVTTQCNARCIMCTVWRKRDSGEYLSVGAIREVVNNPLFDSLESVSLGGGEPTLREDLAEVAEVILDCRPQIKSIGLSTNGLEPELVQQRLEEVARLSQRRGIKFSVGISVDGYGDTHGKIRSVPHAFDRVNETIRLLKELDRHLSINLHINCVVQPWNIKELTQLSRFAEEMELPIQYFPVYIYPSLAEYEGAVQQLEMTPEQKEGLSLYFNDSRYDLLPIWAAFWQDYSRISRGAKRSFPCALLHHNVYIDADGSLYICAADESLVYGNINDAPIDQIWYSDKAKRTRAEIQKNYCPQCTMACDIAFSLGQEFFYFARFLLKEEVKKFIRRFQPGH